MLRSSVVSSAQAIVVMPAFEESKIVGETVQKLVAASLRFELPPSPEAFSRGDASPLA